MTVSRLGSIAAVLGGVAWVAAAVLGWGADEVLPGLYAAGFALLVLALAALGYALVTTAPLWLRVVVTAATPVLGVMVWLIVEDAIGRGYLAMVVGGVLLLVGGGIGLSRAGGRPAGPSPAAHRGRRAAR